jgi:hypothetical protein
MKLIITAADLNVLNASNVNGAKLLAEFIPEKDVTPVTITVIEEVIRAKFDPAYISTRASFRDSKVEIEISPAALKLFTDIGDEEIAVVVKIYKAVQPILDLAKTLVGGIQTKIEAAASLLMRKFV